MYITIADMKKSFPTKSGAVSAQNTTSTTTNPVIDAEFLEEAPQQETQQTAQVAPQLPAGFTPEMFAQFLAFQQAQQAASTPQQTVATPAKQEVAQHAEDFVPFEEEHVPSQTSSAIVTFGGNTPSDVVGEIDRSDFKLPYVKIVALTSKLTAEFPAGCILLEDQVVLANPKEPLGVIPSFVKKGYIENIPYESDATARRFDTLAEVKNAGGCLSYRKGEDNFSEYGQVEFLFPAKKDLTEDEEIFFCWDILGKKYARAIWTFQSTAYEIVRKILTARKQQLAKTGFLGGRFVITSQLVEGKKNHYWSPTIKLVGLNTPEFVEAAREAIG